MRSKPFVFKNPNSIYWKLRYYDNGLPKTISTGIEFNPKKESESKDKAEDWASNFLKDPEQSNNLKPPVKLTTFLNDNFFSNKSLDLHSKKCYKSIVKLLCDKIPEKFIHQYTSQDISDFLKFKKDCFQKEGKDKNGYTLKSYRTHLVVLFNYALSKKFTRVNPVMNAIETKTKKLKIKFFSDEHFSTYLNSIDEQIVWDYSNFAVYTGVRPSDIFRLKIDDTFLEERIIRNYQHKVDEFNTISIADDIYEIVERNYNLNKQLGQEYLFTYVNKKTLNRSQITVNWANDQVKKAVKKAGLPEYYSLKIFRKTFGSVLMQEGDISLEHVANLLGHADTRITKQHYAQFVKKFDKTVNKINFNNKAVQNKFTPRE